MIPEWLQPTFLLFPALLWFFFGVGIPWALALLPRADWRHPILVIAVGMMLGATFSTTVMFVIGTFGTWTIANLLITSGLVSAIGAVIAIRRSGEKALTLNPSPEHFVRRGTLSGLEILLITLIVLVMAIHVWNSAYWPYGNYDEFWVYGYNAQLFTRTGSIPGSLGYYPQLVPLSLTYGQVMWGSVNEHAARTVVPYLELASILMVYVAAGRLFGRRAGIIAAAIWTLYPHQAAWAQSADLEITITFLFTGASAFFIFAWLERSVRYAVVGGLFAAAALWTKPTAGALIESLALIGLIVVGYAIAGGYISRLARRAVGNYYFPRWAGHDENVSPIVHDQGTWSEIKRVWRALAGTPLIVYGVTLLPIGGMWYLRNILYGHPPIVLPGGYWQEEAQRSGQELGWPLILIGLIVLVTLIRQWKTPRYRLELIAGFGLMLIPALLSAFDRPNPHRLTLIEYTLIGIGLVLVVKRAILLWWTLPERSRKAVMLIWAFIVPYFITWFWSYSYHFRLSFAIVPLFIVQIAALVEGIRIPHPSNSPLHQQRGEDQTAGATRLWRVLIGAVIIVGAIPAVGASWGGLVPALNGTLPDDHAKHSASNPALMTLVDFLQARKEALGRPLKVIAPEEVRLPYFFPDDQMIVKEFPTRLSEIEGVDYFVDSSVGQRLYAIHGRFDHNQILASLTRESVLKRAMTIDDGQFRYSAYTVNNAGRFAIPTQGYPYEVHAQFGDFAELYSAELTRNELGQAGRTFLVLNWKSLASTPVDYSVFVHLFDPKAGTLAASWGGEPVSGSFSMWKGVPGAKVVARYHTRLWEPGEYIRDEWVIDLPESVQLGDYELRVGLFDPISNGRALVRKDRVEVGDSLLLTRFRVTP